MNSAFVSILEIHVHLFFCSSFLYYVFFLLHLQFLLSSIRELLLFFFQIASQGQTWDRWRCTEYP